MGSAKPRLFARSVGPKAAPGGFAVDAPRVRSARLVQLSSRDEGPYGTGFESVFTTSQQATHLGVPVHRMASTLEVGHSRPASRSVTANLSESFGHVI